MATLCALAQEVFRKELGPCPALTFDADGSRCGLVDDAPTASHSFAAKILIGAGTGCDCRINGEPVNEGFNRALEAMDRINAGGIAVAKRKWGI